MSYLQKILAVALLTTVISPATFANTRLYVSNNQSVITPEEAFARLESAPETQLQKQMITLLQQSHIEQGQMDYVLGVYQMSQDQQVTADNTIAFEFSPYQKLTSSLAMSIAQHLAEKFNQDSVAIVKTDASSDTVIDRQIRFDQDEPSLKDVMSTIKKQLPNDYQIAYTVYVDGHPKNVAQAHVKKIEWIGSQLSTQILQDVFNHASVKEYKGQAWLVYKDGQTQAL